MRGQVRDAIKTERLAQLQALLGEQARAFNQATVGRVLPVLLERPGRHPGQQVGRTPYLQAVHIEAEASALGRIIDVVITDSHAHSLAAAPVVTAGAKPGPAGRDLPPCA
jgi:tRNA-2-methylthio-N6-dimethylallyladenosine synthase